MQQAPKPLESEQPKSKGELGYDKADQEGGEKGSGWSAFKRQIEGWQKIPGGTSPN